MKVLIPKSYASKEDVRREVQEIISKRVKSGEISSDEDLKKLFGVLEMVLKTLKMVPIGAYAVTESKSLIGQERIPWSIANNIASQIAKSLMLKYIDVDSIDSNTVFEPDAAYPVGSIRRLREDVGDIDLLVTSVVTTQDVDVLKNVDNIDGGERRVNFDITIDGVSVRVNLWICTDKKVFGAALLHATGPRQYNIRIRHTAKSKNMKLSEKGLVDLRTNVVVSSETEASVQKTLGISNREASDR